MKGLEPSRLATLAPKASVSTNSTTSACLGWLNTSILPERGLFVISLDNKKTLVTYKTGPSCYYHSMKTFAIDHTLLTGIDIGGSKIHLTDTNSSAVLRYATNDFADIYELLDTYLQRAGCAPRLFVIAMAGPTDDDTGDIKLANCPWPTFSPHEAEQRYPGTRFVTTNDMTATVAGALAEPGVDVIELKPGRLATKGNRIVATVSTGIGLGAGIWNDSQGAFTYMQCEPGHIGFQPRNTAQKGYLDYLYTKYDHPSIEAALSGKHGMDNWVDYSLDTVDAPRLAHSIALARQTNNPVGAVLLEFATQGADPDKAVARTILGRFGTLLGDVLADFALAYKATGGIYLTGSVAVGLGEYLAQSTDMIATFVRTTEKDYISWEKFLSDIPIHLITDPNVAVAGALRIAREVAAAGKRPS
jgi:glucokinase